MTASHPSYNFWQLPAEQWWLCHHLKYHHDKPKSLPTIKEDKAPDTIKNPHIVKEGKHSYPKEENPRENRKMLEIKVNKTIRWCVRTPYPDIFCRLNEAGTIFSWGNASIWQLQWPQWREASTLAPYVGTVATIKMSTPSRSRSSAKRDEGYFEWRKTMERRQLESKRQMQALLQETRRLREENEVLRIQV